MDPHDAAPTGPASAGWLRCPGAAGSAARDILAEQLVAALVPVDPTMVTAAILTRLREENLFPPYPAGWP